MSIKYVVYKGKRILYVDYRNKVGEQAIPILDEAAAEMRSWSQKGLMLSDFRDAHASPEFMIHLKKIGEEVFAPNTIKLACLGITGVKKILLNAYNSFTKSTSVAFDTEEEAKEYLVKD